MKIIGVLLLAGLSACAQLPEQKISSLTRLLDATTQSKDGIALNNLWPKTRTRNLAPHSLVDIGKYYVTGKYLPKNTELAQNFFDTAFEKSAEEAWSIGYFYRAEMRDDERAIYWYKKSAKAGHVPSLGWLASIYEDKNSQYYDPSKAFEIYHEAVNHGYILSHNAIGRMYLAGTGVNKDAARALKHFLIVADKEPQYAAAETLGRIYLHGNGVPKNLKKSVRWFRKSVQQGNYRTAFWLGESYLDGRFGHRNKLTEAFSWFLVGSTLGDRRADDLLFQMYQHLDLSKALEAKNRAQKVFDETNHQIYIMADTSYWMKMEGIIQ